MDKKFIAFLIAILMIVGGLVTFILFFGKAKNNDYLKKIDGNYVEEAVNESSKNETNTSNNTSKKSSSDDEEDETNTSKNTTKKATDDMTKQVEELEKRTFNSQFEKFQGSQNGTQMLALIDVLVLNNTNNSDYIDKIPVVLYVEENGECFEYTNELDKLRSKIKSDHRYYITVGYNNNTDLIHCIVITYKMEDDIKSQIEDLANEFAGN